MIPSGIGIVRLGWTAALAVSLTACGSGVPDARAREAGGRDEARGRAPAVTSLASVQQSRPAAHDSTSRDIDASRRTAIVRAAEQVAPAVVSVNVLRTERVRASSLFESFFLPPGAQRRSAAFGSGVIVSPEGIVLTNDHVIQNATRIKVTLPGGRDFDAELVGTDQAADIAVLRIHGDDLPVARLGTAEGLLIGEWAIAIGNPLGNYASDAEPTVTAGVVSAVGRNIVPSGRDEGFYLGMIQTDASINPGNSGGPLVNGNGEVIGINASILSRSGGSEGLGFAIPIDRALRVADDLLEYGEIRRAWVGLTVAAAEADEWGRTRGVKVATVAPGSPADGASLHAGDRLLAANGRALTAPLDFEAVLLDLRAGDRLSLDVDGRSRPIPLTAVALPSVTATRVTALRDMELITVTPQVKAERGLVSDDGALITSISDQLAGELGFAVGDVIVGVNRARITSAEDAAKVFGELRAGNPARFYLERDGNYLIRDLYWRR